MFVLALGYVVTSCESASGPAAPRMGPVASIALGQFSCALTTEFATWCWGESTDRSTPTRKTMPDGVTFVKISVGNSACGLTSAGAAYCWGWNAQGQIGDGTVINREIPVPVQVPVGVTLTSIGVATGPYGNHACGLSSAGIAYCWGANESGQLGDSTNASRTLPGVVAMPVGVTFVSLGVGSQHTCGLTGGGDVWCWGENVQAGQLGDGANANRSVPVKVVTPPGVTFAGINISGYHGCGLTAGRAPYCWGWNSRGQLGDGTQTSRGTPTAVIMPAGVVFASIDAAYYHTCALATVGIAYCWGRNVFGELGDGSATTQRFEPASVAMPTGVTFTSVVTGWNHSCGLSSQGQAWCWGVNGVGRLGDGTTVDRPTPVKVLQ